MEIFSGSDKVHLPQTVISVKPRNGLEYTSTANSAPVVEFDIPSAIGYYNAETTILSFDFKYNGSISNIRPQESGGLANMIQQIDIYNGAGVLLEQIMNYDVLNSLLFSFDHGKDYDMACTEYKKRSLTECLVSSNESPTPFVSPAAVWNGLAFVENGDPNEDATYQTQKIQLPIRLSALLGDGGVSNNTIVPVGALGGLKIRFTLQKPEAFSNKPLDDFAHNVKIALDDNKRLNVGDTKIYTIDGTNKVIAAGVNLTEGTYIAADLKTEIEAKVTTLTATFDTGGTADSIKSLTLEQDNTGAFAIDTTTQTFFSVFCQIPPNTTSIGANGELKCTIQPKFISKVIYEEEGITLKLVNENLCNGYNTNTQPFLKGQKLLLRSKDDGDKMTPEIKSIVSSGNKVKIFFKEDWLPDAGEFLTATRSEAIVHSETPDDITYSLQNMSMDLTVITPPPSYIEALMRAIQSPQGLNYSINTFELIRTNAQAGETITQCSLPFTNVYGRGILSIPNKPAGRNFKHITHADIVKDIHPTSYYYMYNGVKHPPLGVDTEKFRAGIDSSEDPGSRTYSLSQELINEQQKAFEYTLDKVRSLQAYSNGFQDRTFFFGKNLGVLNTTFNVRDSNLQLIVEMTGDNALQHTITYNHYLYAENIIRIKPEGCLLIK